ncbi:MAG: ATP-binding cassette domain-containing protein [Lachnospiraceae bacterium]|nr:ATP-binding cassette domain-containing protein [Lachnospiraceae bacterium]
MSYILETDGLTKIYGKKKALDHVSVHISEGDIYGLVGRNGAGKTTLMRIVGGLADASEGSYRLFGKKECELKELVTQRGLLIEDPGYFPNYSAYENIKLKCMALGIKDKDEPMRLLEAVGLRDVAKKAIKKYSFGMKQRVGLALAFAGNPKLIILDEPINGFDPEGIRDIREMIVEKSKQGTTFIISSHILGELSKIATKYGFINEGRLVEESTAEALHEKCRSKIELVTDNTPASATILEQLGFSDFTVFEGGKIEIYEQLERTGDITRALAGQGIATLEITNNFDTLEDYYLNLIGREGAGEMYRTGDTARNTNASLEGEK